MQSLGQRHVLARALRLVLPLLAAAGCGGEIRETPEQAFESNAEKACQLAASTECFVMLTIENCLQVAASERRDAEDAGCVEGYDAFTACRSIHAPECRQSLQLVPPACREASHAWLECLEGN